MDDETLIYIKNAYLKFHEIYSMQNILALEAMYIHVSFLLCVDR